MFYQTQPHTSCRTGWKMPFVVPGNLDLWTLTFKLVSARDQTHLLCELGGNPFSGSRDIPYPNKKPQADSAKNRTFRSSLRAVKINEHCVVICVQKPAVSTRRQHKLIARLIYFRQTATIGISINHLHWFISIISFFIVWVTFPINSIDSFASAYNHNKRITSGESNLT